MEKETETVEKRPAKKEKALVPEVKSVNIKITQEDANALSGITDYLYGRPMNETETGVVFLRGLLQRINESA